MKTTTKCIVCLKKATGFGGHVIDENGKSIIAGWCNAHIDTPIINLLRKKGCFGAWHKKYGLTSKL